MYGLFSKLTRYIHLCRPNFLALWVMQRRYMAEESLFELLQLTPNVASNCRGDSRKKVDSFSHLIGSYQIQNDIRKYLIPVHCVLTKVLSTELFSVVYVRKCTFSAYQLMHKDVFCQARLAFDDIQQCWAFQKLAVKGACHLLYLYQIVMLVAHDTVKLKLFCVLLANNIRNTYLHSTFIWIFKRRNDIVLSLKEQSGSGYQKNQICIVAT